MKKYQEDWNVKVTAVVADNATNMSGMRNSIKAPKQLIHTYGCQAHFFNLLCKDITSSVQNVVSRIIGVVKHLRVHHAESALLEEKNLLWPPIPSEVRWNSLHDTLSYFCTPWSSIVVIVNEILKPGDKIYRDMEDVALKG